MSDLYGEIDEDLRKWFGRKGAPGKKKGWVDCNTCRKDKKTGRKKCSACGRSDGEKRSKYPACRPTPSACGKRGNWGKKSKKKNDLRSLDDIKLVEKELYKQIKFGDVILLSMRMPLHFGGTYYEYPSVHMVKRHYGVRTDRYKLMHFYYDIDEWELYDLEIDPSEMNNRYDDPEYKEIQENLHLRLSELRKQYGDSDSLDQMHIDRYLSTIQN